MMISSQIESQLQSGKSSGKRETRKRRGKMEHGSMYVCVLPTATPRIGPYPVRRRARSAGGGLGSKSAAVLLPEEGRDWNPLRARTGSILLTLSTVATPTIALSPGDAGVLRCRCLFHLVHLTTEVDSKLSY
jgi:hypothetical protein